MMHIFGKSENRESKIGKMTGTYANKKHTKKRSNDRCNKNKRRSKNGFVKVLLE